VIILLDGSLVIYTFKETIGKTIKCVSSIDIHTIPKSTTAAATTTTITTATTQQTGI